MKFAAGELVRIVSGGAAVRLVGLTTTRTPMVTFSGWMNVHDVAVTVVHAESIEDDGPVYNRDVFVLFGDVLGWVSPHSLMLVT
jgi:hypothetical protein